MNIHVFQWSILGPKLFLSLITYLQMDIDKAPFKTPDEAANCAALKTWLTANWSAIATKCDGVEHLSWWPLARLALDLHELWLLGKVLLHEQGSHNQATHFLARN